MAFLKKWQIDDDRGGGQILHIHILIHILTHLLLKIPLVYKTPLGMIFDSKDSKMTLQLSYNLLVLSYWQILSKFSMQYISVKKKMWRYCWVNVFFNHTFLNTINLIWWKTEFKFFLGWQSSIEVSQFFRTTFIKLLLSDYTVYGIFVWENFCHFW